jgi:hypothetical protein
MGGMCALVTSSTTMVSDAVIWPLASVTLEDDVVKAGLRPVLGPSELLPPAGPPTWSPS